jgi:tartrate dehydrogenase/decarboxylase / D-malate dehydrogenase
VISGGTKMKKFEIAVIPGDGIGREVVPSALNVLDTLSEVHGGFAIRNDSV